MARPDVLPRRLGGTAGLRASDDALAGALRRGGRDGGGGAGGARAGGADVRADRPRLGGARAARGARPRSRAARPRAIVYATTTAALLWPEPGAIRFDAPAAGEPPGPPRDLAAAGRAAPLRGGAAAAADERARRSPRRPRRTARRSSSRSRSRRRARPASATSPRSTYGANPEKKGLDRVLAAWRAARRDGETLVVAGARRPRRARRPLRGHDRAGASTGRCCGARGCSWRRRAGRTTASRSSRRSPTAACWSRTPAPGPYAALPLARELDPRLVGDGLAAAIRTALDDPAPGYAERAAALLAPFAPGAVDAVVAERVLPALLEAPRTPPQQRGRDRRDRHDRRSPRRRATRRSRRARRRRCPPRPPSGGRRPAPA